MQTVFHSGALAEESTWQTIVLTPKGDSGCSRGIGLVEVLWKVVTSLLNQYFTASITFHDMLHRFQAVHGTETAVVKAKLPQQLMAMTEAALFEVFLDLQKAYDTLDWYRCLDILAAYVFGPRALPLPRTYWGCLTMVDRAVD